MSFPTLYDLLNQELSDESAKEAIEEIQESIDQQSFQRWYQAQKFAQNIENGKSYFNHPGGSPQPLRHNPSQLIQCHRKTYYSDYNAPKEKPQPLGIFWTGDQLETELIVPYLQAVAPEKVYVQNSIWISFDIKSEIGDLQFKGETDPVFVDRDGAPLLLTEIKTTASIDDLKSPKERHLAQAHCYMYGLSEKFDYRTTEVLLIYLGRTNFDFLAFSQEFDPVFWRQRVLKWAASQSEYQIQTRLPPADPERDEECEFCSFKHRCGKGSDQITYDAPSRGLVPLQKYPREMITQYVMAFEDADVKLTPTVGHQYPVLAEEYGVYDWRCTSCGEEFEWKDIDPPVDEAPVPCPICDEDRETAGNVRGPTPQEQR